VVIRITSQGNKGHKGGKADGLRVPEGSNPGDAMAMSIRISPGSVGRACIERGSSGTLVWPALLIVTFGRMKDDIRI